MSFKAIKPLWRGHEYFSVADAAALLAGFDPTSVEPGGEYFRDPESGLTDSDGIADVQAAFELITGAILAGTLPAKLRHRAEPRYCAGLDQYAERVRWQGEHVFLHDSLSGDEFVIDELPDWSRSMVRAADVIAWLAPKGLVDGFFITEPIAGGGTASSGELEALRQQLGQDRAARDAAEQRAAKAEAEAAEMRTALEVARRHLEVMDAEQEDKPSRLLMVAALLELLTEPVEQPRPKGRNQEAIKTEILGRFPWRGLGKRNLEEIFAAANKAAEKAKEDAG